ncbi:hypothetical protein FRB90_000249, partial [Tulasnella sp. 427]
MSEGTSGLEAQLHKSNTQPLSIEVSFPPVNEDNVAWIPLLLKNAYRWKKISFRGYFELFMRHLDVSEVPSMVEWLGIEKYEIPPDPTLFDPIRETLHHLQLVKVAIPPDIDLAFGLESLDLSDVHGTDSKADDITSVRTIYRILRSNLCLKSLRVSSPYFRSPPTDRLLKLDFPNLTSLSIYQAPILYFINAEHCMEFSATLTVHAHDPRTRDTWSTMAQALRRARRLHFEVGSSVLKIEDAESPDGAICVQLRRDVDPTPSDPVMHDIFRRALILLASTSAVPIPATLTLWIKRSPASLDFSRTVCELLRTPIRDHLS